MKVIEAVNSLDVKVLLFLLVFQMIWLETFTQSENVTELTKLMLATFTGYAMRGLEK